MNIGHILLLLAGFCLLALGIRLYRYINREAQREYPDQPGAQFRLYLMLIAIVICGLLTLYYAIFKQH
ncbi:MAG: hypothetical protein V4592_12420 [Bacteroidota bacterium]